jgi:hypothetical protein
MFTFREASQQPNHKVGLEAQALGRLERAFLEHIGRGFVLESEFEMLFYSSNNLPEQLKKLFGTLNPRRLDEDLLERSCLAANQILRGASLLDNTLQKISLALKNAKLYPQGHLRREWDSETSETSETIPECFEFALEPNDTQAFFALKRLWAADWSFDAVLQRLDHTAHYGLEARPVLFFAGPKPQLDLELGKVLGVQGGVLSSGGKCVGMRLYS